MEPVVSCHIAFFSFVGRLMLKETVQEMIAMSEGVGKQAMSVVL